MDEIIQFVENLCSLLSFDPFLEQICDSIIENNLPEIINGLVNDNLNPSEVCQNIGMAPSPTPLPHLKPPPPPPPQPALSEWPASNDCRVRAKLNSSILAVTHLIKSNSYTCTFLNKTLE